MFIFSAGPDWEPEAASDWTARVWCPDLLQEGHWHHLVVVLNRAVLKNSALSIYVDGQQLQTQKVINFTFLFFFCIPIDVLGFMID